MRAEAIFEALLLLMVANGAPLVAKQLLGQRFSYPVDCNVLFSDGSRLFGSSKTIRGLVAAVLATATVAIALGMDWPVGVLVGAMAMTGDLFSSFIKRRLGMRSSSMALGLDQVPEALFPLTACRDWLSLGLLDIVIAVLLFFVGEIVLSRLCFAVGLRDRPY
jgi:CDP-2,3-bis-(O-geranylgeranyl)-sn-glycerol synthase